MDLQDVQLRCSIEFSVSYPLWAQKKASIEQKTWFGLEALGEPIGLDEARHLVRHLQDFLTLGIGNPTYVTECKLTLDGVGLGLPMEAALFWPQPFVDSHQGPISPFEMLFTRRDLGEQIANVIRNWFTHRSTLQGLFDLYFGALYNPHLYVESVFLSFVQALELYHRELGPTKHGIPEDEYNRLFRAIMQFEPIQSAPKEYRKWIHSRLKHNEPTLRQRLSELLNAHGYILDRYINERKKKRFIQKVLDTRNYLVHRNERLRDRAARGQELLTITRTLSLIIQLCLLELLGLSSEQIEALLERHRWLLRGLWGSGDRYAM